MIRRDTAITSYTKRPAMDPQPRAVAVVQWAMAGPIQIRLDDMPDGGVARNLSTMTRGMALRGLDTVMAPVWVSYQMHRVGLDFGQVMIGQAILAVATIVCEVPSGVFADRFGKARALRVAAFCWLGAACALALATGVVTVAASMAMFGVATAIASGAAEALVFDTLHALRREGEYARVLGKTQSSFFGVGVFGSVAGGFLAEHAGLSAVAWVMVMANVFSVLNAMLLIEPGLALDAARNRYHFGAAVRLVVGRRKVLLVALFAIPVALADVVIYRVLNPIWEIEGVALSVFGVAYSGYSLASAAASALAGRITGRFGERSTMTVGVLGLAAALFAIGSAHGVVAVLALPVLIAMVTPVLSIAVSSIINRVTESQHRATVLSLQSLVARLGIAAIVPLFGFGVERFGMATGLHALAAGIGVAGVALCCGLPRLSSAGASCPSPTQGQR